MPFDPSQPFEVIDEPKNGFDPSQPFETVSDSKAPPLTDSGASLGLRPEPLLNPYGPRSTTSQQRPQFSTVSELGSAVKAAALEPAFPIPRLPDVEKVPPSSLERGMINAFTAGNAPKNIDVPVQSVREAANLAIGVPEFLESGAGITAAGAGVIAPIATAAAFTADMAHSLWQQVPDLWNKWDKLTNPQRAKALVDIVGTGGLMALLGHGGIKGVKAKVEAKARQSEKAPPLVTTPEQQPGEAPPITTELKGPNAVLAQAEPVLPPLPTRSEPSVQQVPTQESGGQAGARGSQEAKPQEVTTAPKTSEDFVNLKPEELAQWQSKNKYGSNEDKSAGVTAQKVTADWTIEKDLPKLMDEIDRSDDAVKEVMPAVEAAMKAGKVEEAMKSLQGLQPLQNKRGRLLEFARDIPGVREQLKGIEHDEAVTLAKLRSLSEPKAPNPGATAPAPKGEQPPISKSEQARLLSEAGMNKPHTQPGLPTPESAQGQEPRVTSIKNEIVDKERAARGLPPAMEPARRSFGTVWDEAMKIAEENPKRQDELIGELRDKPRALTDLEDALLLHRQVDLQNQYAKEVERLNTAADAGDQAALNESRLRGAKLEDDLLDIYNIGKRSGTESGRGLNARKILAAEDFSLGSMIAQKRAASGGAKLNAAQSAEIGRLKKIIDATQKALDEHVKKAAKRREAKKAQDPRASEQATAKTKTASTKAVTLDPEAQRLKAQAEEAKIAFKRGLVKDRLRQRPLAQKTADAVTNWRRAMLLSSPVTLAKLTAAALERFAFTPLEEAVGAGIGQVPGMSKIAERAPRQGGLSVRAEAKALTDGIMKGMKDARDILKKGQGELEVFGKENLYPRDWLNFFGEIHAALKAPTKRNEFARSFQKRVEHNLRKGIDVTDPLVQTRIAQEAYRDANSSIFMQDNRVVNAYKAGIRTLEAPQASKGAKSVAATARFLLPIVKVPTNIVAEALQHATGLVTGSVRAANALRKGVEKLKPEEADLIMQDLKKGSLGGALMLTGFLLPEVVGGYYQPGQKRKAGEVKFGSVKIGDTQVPSYLLHNPLLEMLQLGATIRRVADGRLRKKDQDPQGLTNGAIAGALGLLDEVPFLREVLEVRKAFDPRQRQDFMGELAKSTAVPAGVEWLARQDDVDTAGEVIKRDPKTVWEHIQSAIPIARKELPRKKTQ